MSERDIAESILDEMIEPTFLKPSEIKLPAAIVQALIVFVAFCEPEDTALESPELILLPELLTELSIPLSSNFNAIVAVATVVIFTK